MEGDRRDFLMKIGAAGIMAGTALGAGLFSNNEPYENRKMALLGSVLANARKRQKEKVENVELIEGGDEKETGLVFPETDVLSNEFGQIVSSLDENTTKAINKVKKQKSSLFSGKKEVASIPQLLYDKWQEIYDRELAEQRKRNMEVQVGTIIFQEKILVPLAMRAVQEFGVPLWVIMGVIGVESGGDQYAYNAGSGAAGIMQITEGTAKDLGLKMDWETAVDERFDMEKNVMAAAKYLGELYQKFGQWSLALTAYSGGPRNLRDRIIECYAKNNVKGEDFGTSKTKLDIPPAQGLIEKGVNSVTLYSKQFCGQGGDHSVQYPFWVEAMAKLMKEKMGSQQPK